MLEKLQKLGLSQKESHIYLALVKLGEAAPNHLAKYTSSNRTVTYNVLQQLVEKGLVAYVKKEGKRVYCISRPESLLASVKEKEEVAKDLMSEIGKIMVQPASRKNVEVYEGLEGMKVIFDEIRKAKNLRVINATGLIFEYLKFSAKHIVKDMEKTGRPKVIGIQSMKKTPLAKADIIVKYLPKEADNYATTFIFDNTVVIQVLKDKPFLIKIENEEIFEGYKKDFDVLWSKL
jgi:sugar-specific transcriptional regulator TrmB